MASAVAGAPRMAGCGNALCLHRNVRRCAGLPHRAIRQSRVFRSAAVVEPVKQKSEIFHAEGGIVRTVMRYNGTTLLETTQYQGLFQLDRLDNGRRTKYEPETDLKSLFRGCPG